MADHSLNARWSPSPDIASRKVANEIVLLNVKTSDYYSVNPTASLVWDLVRKDKGLQEILAAMEAEFDADPEKIKKDVLRLLKALESENIILRVI
ncbi:MAG: hypothetical protein A2234_08235 [Elusimicrobia bacterium RIFOXYA2_FULL_58_8]|nr:MAG: hypothetical protein A2285_01370 [Elusimicrobia bacterium RIFOXYA12_FULL_57_11]OGS17064.1 MAG: hypothetical protein A2234_08235 [Elusimicrobia bacterium RIFOXYA2_FULL_58_8]